MSSPAPDRKGLEEIWHKRVKDARLRLDRAMNDVMQVQRDFPAAVIPPPDSNFALRKARHAESTALTEYGHVLRIYTDLIVHGIIPNEAEWLKAQAAD